MAASPEKKAGKLILAVATVLGLGYAPVAPGTAGTLGAVGLVLLLGRLWWPYYLLIWVLVFALACFVSQRVSEATGEGDPSLVVIDEVAGYLAAMFLLPLKPSFLIASFLIFRGLDIIKPYPASYFDQKMKNGLGIVMDDVIAGIYTCLVLHGFWFFWSWR